MNALTDAKVVRIETAGAMGATIGAILIDEGRLSPEDAEKVLRLQREQRLRFGEAAKRLRLVSDEDIQFALARQFDYPCLNPGSSTVSQEVTAAYAPASPAVEHLRTLRTQLMLRWFAADEPRRSLAIVSPAKGEGKSYLTANLAVVFSQLGERTLIVDANMRDPRQHELFGLDNGPGLSALLTGRCALDAIQRVSSLRNLSVMPAGTVPPNPAELLARPGFSELLSACASQYDVILIDTPAGADFSDAFAVVMRSGGALVVAHKNRSANAELRMLGTQIQQTGAVLLGSVLNEGM